MYYTRISIVCMHSCMCPQLQVTEKDDLLQAKERELAEVYQQLRQQVGFVCVNV